MVCVPLAVAILTVRSIGLNAEYFGDPWYVVMLVVATVLSLILGFFAAIPTAWVLLGPILMEQGIVNGGPFVPGDIVQIIAGPHRNRRSHVYSTWQHETVRVDLGEQAKAEYADIFAAFQLLRVEPGEQSDAHETPAHSDLNGKSTPRPPDPGRSPLVIKKSS